MARGHSGATAVPVEGIPMAPVSDETHFMTRAGSAFDRLLLGLAACAGAVICTVAVLITLDVVLRNIGVSSFTWLLEVAEYALFVTTFIAAPWVLSLGSHVRVDLLVTTVSAASARRLELAVSVLGAVICVTLGWHGLRVAADSFFRGDLIYKELVVPEWTLLVFIPFGCLLLTIEFLRRFVKMFRGGAEQSRNQLTDGV